MVKNQLQEINERKNEAAEEENPLNKIIICRGEANKEAPEPMPEHSYFREKSHIKSVNRRKRGSRILPNVYFPFAQPRSVHFQTEKREFFLRALSHCLNGLFWGMKKSGGKSVVRAAAESSLALGKKAPQQCL